MEAQAFAAASEQLSLKRPDYSARWGMNARQRIIGFILTIGYAVWLYVSAQSAMQVSAIAIASVFAVIIAMRFLTVVTAVTRRPATPALHANDEDLPTPGVLVPLYREANVVPQLIAAISRLDYPRRLLDVKLLVGADDAETIAAIVAEPLPACFEVIPVPPGLPPTKPKALNYALAFARGEIVAIFDAEDAPSPDQARAVMAAFREGPATPAVVRALLQVHKGRQLDRTAVRARVRDPLSRLVANPCSGEAADPTARNQQVLSQQHTPTRRRLE